MPKTEVYSWRLSSQLKGELEKAACSRQKSMAELLEEIAREWLERFRNSNGDDAERQRVLHEAGMKWAGTIQGSEPNRAQNARSLVQAQIARKHGR